MSRSPAAPWPLFSRICVIPSSYRRRPRQFHRGDMVFFQRQDGSYVMHRIHHLKEGKLYLVGDNQTEIEGPIDPEQVFGIVRKVIRNGKLLQKGDFWWDFFEKAWIRIVPLRSAAVKAVSIVYKLRNRQKR